MADIDATAILAAAQHQGAIDAAPTDESLNAGSFLPSEPVGDVLCNEIVADVSVIAEMIPELNAELPVTESMYMALSYLRDDLTSQRGMNRVLATEAISLIPNFGRNKPVSYYSKHTSITGLDAALEELDAEGANDVLNQLHGIVANLDRQSVTPGINHLVNNLDFSRSAGQACMSADVFKQFQKNTEDAGFKFADKTFQGCAIDPSQGDVPGILQLPLPVAVSFAEMDDYYMVHLQAPAMLEVMMRNLTEWKAAFTDYLTGLQNTEGSKVNAYIVKSPSVTLANGKTVSIDNIADVFRSAADKIDAGQDVKYATADLVTMISNAADEAKVDDIISRAKSYNALCAELSDVVQALADYVSDYPRGSDQLTFVTDGAYKLASAFAGVVQAQHKAFGEIASWCLNASLSVSYSIALANSVAKFAWKSFHQDKDNLQIPEGMYACLEAAMLDLQDIVKTNAV